MSIQRRAMAGDDAVMAIRADWIAVDWGTTHMRAWALDAGGAVLARAASEKGMGTLAPEEFEGALLESVGDWLAPEASTEVIACGMVGARQGWIEAPYTRIPAPPLGGDPVPAPVEDRRISVRIIAGLCQADPPDVMRGEETQIAGFIARHGGDGVVCLPGTHSKWVRLEGGTVEAFHTEMTGELFALLAGKSVLRHSISTDDWADDAFFDGVSRAIASEKPVLSQLFAIRAQSLLHGLAPGAGRAGLSGLLIGAEIAATRDLWTGRTVALIGSDRLTALYARAIALAGGTTTIHNAEEMTLAGLIATRARLK